MNILGSMMLITILFVLLPASHSEEQNIDWGTEISRAYERFQLDFVANNMTQLIGDVMVGDFVYITQNSIVQGDTEELANLEISRSKRGHWEAGHQNVVSTCGNTALIWAELLFKDDKSGTWEGKLVILYEFVDDKALVKLIQKSV